MLNYRNYGRLWRVYGLSTVRYGTPRKIWNALRTEWAYRRRQVAVKTPPYLLFIEPLYYCNLDCPLCDRQTFPGARKRDAGKLPLDLYDKILDEIGAYLLQCHIFGLGEPLLNWPLTKAIIEKTHRRRIFTLVSTNCTLITPKIADEIVRCGLDYLVCAIDGITQESYGQYRIGGQVDKALQGLRLLCEARRKQRSTMEIEWQFLVNRFNVGEMDAARQMADELGIFLRFAPMGGMEWEPELQKYWLPPAAAPATAANATVSTRSTVAATTTLSAPAAGPNGSPAGATSPVGATSPAGATSPTAAWQDSKLDPGEVRNDFHCYWLWRGVVINSNGRMARCPGYQNVAQLGSVRDQTVMELYNGEQSQRARQLFSKTPVAEGAFPTPCNTCAFYKRERGGPYLNKAQSVGRQAAPAAPTIIPLEAVANTAASVHRVGHHD